MIDYRPGVLQKYTLRVPRAWELRRWIRRGRIPRPPHQTTRSAHDRFERSALHFPAGMSAWKDYNSERPPMRRFPATPFWPRRSLVLSPPLPKGSAWERG